MYADPVVEEIRRHAEKIAEECGDDIHRMAERFRREQAQHGGRVVTRGTFLPTSVKPESPPNRP